MSIEAAVETVEIENARQALRALGTDLEIITRMDDGRWLVATAGRHRVQTIDVDQQTAIRRATETVTSMYEPTQTAWLARIREPRRRR